ncbi:hypothetical protein ACLOJK_016345 [Asimina triloba]
MRRPTIEETFNAVDGTRESPSRVPVGAVEDGFGMSYELLYGRAGFLWSALFTNKHLGLNSLPLGLLMPVVEAVLAGGRVGASNNENYPANEETWEDVKGTLRYMVRNRFPYSGNYPSSEGNPSAKLVFATDREIRDAAIEAGEVVWRRGLVGKVGLSDGICGNAYTFLSLYRLTGDKLDEERATAFASYLYHNARNLVSSGHMRGDDNACSLFQGLAGAACLWFDLLTPRNSSFPGFEL